MASSLERSVTGTRDGIPAGVNLGREGGGCKGLDVDPAKRHRYMPDMNETVETLPILVVPDPILKIRAKQVAPGDMDRVRTLVRRMFATMYQAPGIGLAAPQVGVGLRVAVVDLQPDEKPAPIALINPEVIATSDELATREEGCLSLPGQYAEVTRPVRVTVRYTDIDGARRQIEAEGLLSACLQHEIDHLDGVLFVDHLSALKRNMILRRLAKEQRQKRAEAM
jgi:peptide deformylase